MSNNKQVLSHTSPHVFRFNERISLNKQSIADNVFGAFGKIRRDNTRVSTILLSDSFLVCLCVLTRVAIDYLILEVGIGGRLDAANLIDADITAITNIDFDHCEILGDTLDKIGREKVGIARAEVPLFWVQVCLVVFMSMHKHVAQ